MTSVVAMGGERNVTFTPCVLVSGGSLKRPWVVSSTFELDGNTFMRLNADHGLNRFVGTDACAKKFFHDLIKMRNQECHRALHADDPSIDGSSVAVEVPAKWSGTYQSRQAFARAKRRASNAAPTTVQLALPTVTIGDQTAGPIDMAVKFTMQANEPVSVEFDPDVLDYIRLALRSSPDVERAKRPRDEDLPRGSRFQEDRGPYGSFLVRRSKSCTNEKLTKSKFEHLVVPIVDNDMDAARAIVDQFLAGEDVTPPRHMRRRRPKRRRAPSESGGECESESGEELRGTSPVRDPSHDPLLCSDVD